MGKEKYLFDFVFILHITFYSVFGPVWAPEHCRISPPCLLAECRERRLNQGSFVLLYFTWFVFFWFVFSLCIVCIFNLSSALCEPTWMTPYSVTIVLMCQSLTGMYSLQCLRHMRNVQRLVVWTLPPRMRTSLYVASVTGVQGTQCTVSCLSRRDPASRRWHLHKSTSAMCNRFRW